MEFKLMAGVNPMKIESFVTETENKKCHVNRTMGESVMIRRNAAW
jgi:uncharacterized OsmC-like protein